MVIILGKNFINGSKWLLIIAMLNPQIVKQYR